MPEEDRRLLLTVARVVLTGRRGTLAQQLKRAEFVMKSSGLASLSA